jgi:hypothetical protein
VNNAGAGSSVRDKGAPVNQATRQAVLNDVEMAGGFEGLRRRHTG